MIRAGQQVFVRASNASRAMGIADALGYVIELVANPPALANRPPTARAEMAVVYVYSRKLVLRLEMLEAIA